MSKQARTPYGLANWQAKKGLGEHLANWEDRRAQAIGKPAAHTISLRWGITLVLEPGPLVLNLNQHQHSVHDLA